MGYKSNVAGLLGKPSMYIFELNDESWLRRGIVVINYIDGLKRV